MAAQLIKEKERKTMKVFVVVPRPDRAPVALTVSKDDTVASVKVTLHDMEGIRTLYEMEGIPPSRQRLVFACSALPDDDDTTLADHGVTDSATIQLVETNMDVHVRHTDRLHTFSGVETSDTVESFRLRLQEREGIRSGQQRIIYGGRQLEDGHTLADYGVRDYATMQLSFLRRREVQLDIEVTDTVGRIKERVEEAEGVPVACQSVYISGDKLDDSRALGHYGALETSTPVYIRCQPHKRGAAANTTTKGEAPAVVKMETVKRRTDSEVSVPEKKIKKRKRTKKKPLTEIADVQQRRRLPFCLVGPELAGSISPSSCDTDPVYWILEVTSVHPPRLSLTIWL